MEAIYIERAENLKKYLFLETLLLTDQKYQFNQ